MCGAFLSMYNLCRYDCLAGGLSCAHPTWQTTWAAFSMLQWNAQTQTASQFIWSNPNFTYFSINLEPDAKFLSLIHIKYAADQICTCHHESLLVSTNTFTLTVSHLSPSPVIALMSHLHSPSCYHWLTSYQSVLWTVLLVNVHGLTATVHMISM